MTVTQFVITFGASAVQFTAPPSAGGAGVAKVHAEPLRSNTHASYVGLSNVTNDGSGTGVLKQLAVPQANVALETFDIEHNESKNVLEAVRYYAHGTSGEKLVVSYHQY